MTEIISLVTSIAACLSAIAALIVVRQNYKQRTASYRPELVLVKTTVMLRSFEETGGFPRVAEENKNSKVSIPIVNVGLGAARGLKVSWKFPVDRVVSSANRLAQAYLKSEIFELRDGLFLTNTEGSWGINWKGEQEEEIDYILPASLQHSPPNELRLPMTYVALFAGIHYFSFKLTTSNFPDVPPLECRLEFTDVGGAKHSMDLLIYVETYMVGVNGIGVVIRSAHRGS